MNDIQNFTILFTKLLVVSVSYFTCTKLFKV